MGFDVRAPAKRGIPRRFGYAGKRERLAAGDFAVGIEEEYFLADAQSMDVAESTCDTLFEAAELGMPGRVKREFLQAQIEVATAPHVSLAAACEELLHLRQVAAEAARAHGLATLASGTHPTARWSTVLLTQKERYVTMLDDLQMIGQRNMLCGMHVHVAFPDPARRVDVMARMLPFLPLILALSTSSPFWQGRLTGLKGYRLAAYDELPRTGLPELFRTAEEYEAYVAALVRSGVMEDSSHVWWAMRPSGKYPTLELRAPDCCTRIEDAVAIAALYRCLARRFYLDRARNAEICEVTRALAVENKWRAQRFGIEATFATREGALSLADVLAQAVELVADDAEVLGCADELLHCRTILMRGTSADEQIRVYTETVGECGEQAALRAVGEWIATATLARGDAAGSAPVRPSSLEIAAEGASPRAR